MLRLGQQGAASLFFLLFGSAAIVFGRDMQIGTAGEMGIGYVPRMLAYGCIAVGLWLGAVAVMARTERTDVAFAWRPALLVTALVVTFGLLLPRLGLPATIIAVVIGAGALSGERFRWPMLLATAALLATLSTLLFHSLLRLQVPVWPAVLA